MKIETLRKANEIHIRIESLKLSITHLKDRLETSSKPFLPIGVMGSTIVVPREAIVAAIAETGKTLNAAIEGLEIL